MPKAVNADGQALDDAGGEEDSGERVGDRDIFPTLGKSVLDRTCKTKPDGESPGRRQVEAVAV